MAGQALEGLLFASIDVLRIESAAVANRRGIDQAQ